MTKRDFDDDLFKESTMSFGEHLEELRTCLFRASSGLFFGVIVGMCIAKYVVSMIQYPMERALITYYQDKAVRSAREALGPDFTPEIATTLKTPGMMFDQVFVDPNMVSQSLEQAFPQQFDKGPTPVYRLCGRDLKPQLIDALIAADGSAEASPARRIWKTLDDTQRETLKKPIDQADPYARTRHVATALNGLLDRADLFEKDDLEKVKLDEATEKLWDHKDQLSHEELAQMNWGILAAAFPEQVTAVHRYMAPLLLWRATKDDPRTSIAAFSAQEPFVIWMKAGLIAGLVIASPWIFYQIWIFVAAGLYPAERRYVHVFLPFSVGLFLLGAAMAYIFVFDRVLSFLFDFNDWLGMKIEPRISEWLSMVLWLPIGFGISFQLPLVMLFLERIGVVTVKVYQAQWRVAVLGIFVLAMLLAPSPDPYSMCLMAVPLTVLYFGGIVLCQQAGSRRIATAR